jgi:hypothetical protein
MLRACGLQYGRSWDKSLSYAEFSYNNSYQESLKMAPFEMLYGRRCRTLLFWSETGEWKVFGPDILQEAEKQVCMVRENLWVAQSRQKSYADHRRRELSFEVGDFVYLMVSPMRFTLFHCTRQARTNVHWTIPDFVEERWSGLPIGVVTAVVWCHTPFRESGNEASIRVLRMFKSCVHQQYDKHVPCSILQSNYHLHNDPWV